MQDCIFTVNQDVLMPTIDWTRYVDAIYCIHYLPYKERKKPCDAELAFMDILSSPIFKYYWTYQEKYDDIIVDYMHPTYVDFQNDRKQIASNLTHAYYRIFRESQEFGYRSIITIEDDVRFDRKKQYMLDTLNNLPENWDYIVFDKILTQKENYRIATIERGPYFGSNYTGGFWGTAMTMWSSNAMRVATNILENELWPADYILANRDDDRLSILNRYVTTHTLLYQDDQLPRYHFVLS